MHLRTRPGAESLLAPQVERVVRDLNPTLPVYDVRTLNEHVEKNLFLRRIPARMFVVLGPLLLLLAAIGIYSVVAYAVSLRTTEIGVRLALGATPAQLTRLVAGDGLRLALTGVAVGAVLALPLASVLGALIFGVQIADLATFAGTCALLLAVATIASFLPARRAARLDPIVAL
jgi:ABC-type antimicrobial peptide transport system permease subunit